MTRGEQDAAILAGIVAVVMTAFAVYAVLSLLGWWPGG